MPPFEYRPPERGESSKPKVPDRKASSKPEVPEHRESSISKPVNPDTHRQRVKALISDAKDQHPTNEAANRWSTQAGDRLLRQVENALSKGKAPADPHYDPLPKALERTKEDYTAAFKNSIFSRDYIKPTTREANLTAVRELGDAYKKAEEEKACYDRATSSSMPSLETFRDPQGKLDTAGIKAHFSQKIGDIEANLSKLDQKKNTGPLTSLELHILERQDSLVHPSDTPQNPTETLNAVKAGLKADLQSWKEAQKFSDRLSKTSDQIKAQKAFVNRLQPSNLERITARTKTELRVIGFPPESIELVGHRHVELSNRIDYGVSEIRKENGPNANSLIRRARDVQYLVDTNFLDAKKADYYRSPPYRRNLDSLEAYKNTNRQAIKDISQHEQALSSHALKPDLKEFVNNYAQDVHNRLEGHKAFLFENTVLRHQADRHASTNGNLDDRIHGILPSYFHPDEWRKAILPADNQSQSFRPSSEYYAPCVPTSLTHFYSDLPKAEKLTKFQEIYHAHPRGMAGLGPWTPEDAAHFLNQEIQKNKLSISVPEGKELAFSVHENFDEESLRGFMSVKDRNGDYIPVMLGISSYNPNTEDFDGHAVVATRIKTGDGSFQLHVHDPYTLIKPVDPQKGLSALVELSHLQMKDDGTYEPGYMGPNSAMVPILIDKPVGEIQ